MSRRRRPHPARRARRISGGAVIGVYAGLLATVGWAQRSTEVDLAPTPVPEQADQGPLGIERLDLNAAPTFQIVPNTSLASSAAIPTPPPPPSVAVTTTVAPRITASPATGPTTIPPVATTTITPPTTALPTTTTAPTTTPPHTAPPSTTVPPESTIPTGGS